jgi:tetratricopeptide (TPR) repeat protein
MAWLRRKTDYDRSRILAQATRARTRGNARKAIALYRRVLEHEPENGDLHRRIAPLLAATRQNTESWASYTRAVEHLRTRGFLEHAIGVLREAADCLKGDSAVWDKIAELQIERGRPIDASRALLEGSRLFRSRKDRSRALGLLLRARELAPGDFPVNFELTRHLARSGARRRALRILDELASTTRGRQLRRVRRRQFCLAPSPAALWRWLRACFMRR